MGFSWLADVIERYALLEAAQRVLRPMLVDEGLAQKAPTLIPVDSERGDRRTAYYQSMPLVRSVLFLKCSPSIADRRLIARSRQHVAFRHGYLTDGERMDDLAALDAAFTEGLQILARRGLEVIELDATRPIRTNVAIVLDRLGTIDVE
jgi:hypothetical protein